MSLLVVGSVAFDDLESPFGSKNNVLGGSASYFSLSASRHTGVRVVAVVGEDFGPEEFRVFANRPIDLGGLVQAKGRTFRWKGAYGWDLNEAQTLETQLNVFADFHPVLPQEWRSSEHLFLGNIHPTLQLDVVHQMVGRPKWVALDTMNYWIKDYREELGRVLKEVDILLVNESEIRALTHEHNLVKAYQKVRTYGPTILVIKRGEYGVMLFTPDGIFAAPAYPLEDVYDPTGAGDTFAGGFLGSLVAQGGITPQGLKKAILAGSVLASFTVQEFGTACLQTITDKDIADRMRVFSDMIRVDGL